MSTRTVRHTDYFIEDGGNTFPVNFEPVDGSEIIQITGNAAKVGYLVHDPESHFDWYFDEYDQGKFYGFDNRSKGYDPKDRDEVAEIARDNPGRVFWIHKYEHSSSRYYRAGDALTPAVELHGAEPAEPGLFIPDQQWDVSRGAALFVVPEDVTEPAEYCDGTMKEFSSWCNGDIYGVVTQTYTRLTEDADWEPNEDDACWGHIGHEWAEQALADEMK